MTFVGVKLISSVQISGGHQEDHPQQAKHVVLIALLRMNKMYFHCCLLSPKPFEVQPSPPRVPFSKTRSYSELSRAEFELLAGDC